MTKYSHAYISNLVVKYMVEVSSYDKIAADIVIAMISVDDLLESNTNASLFFWSLMGFLKAKEAFPKNINTVIVIHNGLTKYFIRHLKGFHHIIKEFIR